MKAKIKAIEYYFPSKTESREDLEKDNPDWPLEQIEQKTGVKTRYLADFKETAVDMAVKAVDKLFDRGFKKEEVDFLILVTQSPDYCLPTSACILQDRLNLSKATIAFDLNLGCSGFVYGLAVCGSLIESGLAKKGVLVCSETYTKYIDKADRTCRPLFSDAAAATLIETSDSDGVKIFEMGTDGSGFANLIVPGSGFRVSDEVNRAKKLFMDGAKVFMFAMEMVPKCVSSLLKKSGKTIDDIDLFVFHQASQVVMDNIIRRLDLPREKVFINGVDIGNTVSASIPIALKDASDQRLLKKGDLVMLVGFGVGYSWGGCLMQWEEDL